MRKHLTDAEKIAILLDALHRADRTLMEIDAVAEINSIARGIGNRRCSEWTQSVTRRARKILQSALKRVTRPQAGQAPAQALDCGSLSDVPSDKRNSDAKRADNACTAEVGSASLADEKAIRIDIQAMKANGILKEAKRK
jgi:hypothetical protein